TTVWAPAVASVAARPTATRSVSSRPRFSMMSSLMTCVADGVRPILPPGTRRRRRRFRARPPPAGSGEPHRAGDAARHDVHEADQEDAVDGPRRSLGDLLG